MRDVGSAEIEATLDRKMGLVFDLLCDQLAEDDLLGEVLAADHDALAVVTGSERQKCECEGNRQESGRSRDPTNVWKGTALSRAEPGIRKIDGTTGSRALPGSWRVLAGILHYQERLLAIYARCGASLRSIHPSRTSADSAI